MSQPISPRTVHVDRLGFHGELDLLPRLLRQSHQHQQPLAGRRARRFKAHLNNNFRPPSTRTVPSDVRDLKRLTNRKDSSFRSSKVQARMLLIVPIDLSRRSLFIFRLPRVFFNS